jgi:hypothetical protein
MHTYIHTHHKHSFCLYVISFRQHLKLYIVDQFVKIGQRAAIRCIAAGNPTPNVSWTLDGQPLPNVHTIKEGNFNNGLGDVISYVNISSVDIAYGRYTSDGCPLSNLNKLVHKCLNKCWVCR